MRRSSRPGRVSLEMTLHQHSSSQATCQLKRSSSVGVRLLSYLPAAVVRSFLPYGHQDPVVFPYDVAARKSARNPASLRRPGSWKMSSEEHWDTMKIYKELDRQDKAAAAAGVTAPYKETSSFQQGWQPARAESSSSPSNNTPAGGGTKK